MSEQNEVKSYDELADDWLAAATGDQVTAENQTTRAVVSIAFSLCALNEKLDKLQRRMGKW